MITYIKINGFKSFHNFEMEFMPFTVIAGVNASGKSNLFDALKLLSRLAEADNLKKAFKEQRGDFIELFTQYAEGEYATEMEFYVEMLVDKTITDDWGDEAELTNTRLCYSLKIKRFTKEFSDIKGLAIEHESLGYLHKPYRSKQYIEPDNKILTDKWAYISTIGHTVSVYDGIKYEERIRSIKLNKASRTVLSDFNTVESPHILAAKKEILSWKFLQLNPADLQQPTNKNDDDDSLSETGKNLAGVLYRLKQQDPYTLIEISRKFQQFLPEFIEVDAIDDAERNQYLIKVKDTNKKTYSSRVLSEGSLRILALCVLAYDDTHTGLLCFEEPENGVHPLRIETMAQLLKDLSTDDLSDDEESLRQVIVNTHSPVLVGYINRWENDSAVSIWYASQRSRVADIENKRRILSISVILPVIKENVSSFEHLPSEADKKLTLSNLRNYLESTSNQL